MIFSLWAFWIKIYNVAVYITIWHKFLHVVPLYAPEYGYWQIPERKPFNIALTKRRILNVDPGLGVESMGAELMTGTRQQEFLGRSGNLSVHWGRATHPQLVHPSIRPSI